MPSNDEVFAKLEARLRQIHEADVRFAMADGAGGLITTPWLVDLASHVVEHGMPYTGPVRWIITEPWIWGGLERGRKLPSWIKPSHCYYNVANLFHGGYISKGVVGWAVQIGSIWKPHAWGLMDDGEIIETTERRDFYYGVVPEKILRGIPT